MIPDRWSGRRTPWAGSRRSTGCRPPRGPSRRCTGSARWSPHPPTSPGGRGRRAASTRRCPTRSNDPWSSPRRPAPQRWSATSRTRRCCFPCRTTPAGRASYRRSGIRSGGRCRRSRTRCPGTPGCRCPPARSCPPPRVADTASCRWSERRRRARRRRPRPRWIRCTPPRWPRPRFPARWWPGPRSTTGRRGSRSRSGTRRDARRTTPRRGLPRRSPASWRGVGS